MTHLVNSKHCDNFRKSVLELLEVEFEEISKQLEKENTIVTDGCLWVRYNQLRIMIAVADGKYKYDDNQRPLGDRSIVEILD